jgi:hypothetical protein|tara:strand:- start:7194 stop:7604 length:411 start_codon:yes stop_codon:yes gene_type:complete
MTNRRSKLLTKLLQGVKGEDEAKLLKLTIERICADMCEFYTKFYEKEGPGAMVYVPDAEDEKKSMFYLTVDHLINALNDFNNRSMSGVAEVMQKAINRAEQIEPDKESLFIIQDQEKMQLVHYKHDSEGADFIKIT